jgi:hypothetical protein
MVLLNVGTIKSVSLPTNDGYLTIVVLWVGRVSMRRKTVQQMFIQIKFISSRKCDDHTNNSTYCFQTLLLLSGLMTQVTSLGHMTLQRRAEE